MGTRTNQCPMSVDDNERCSESTMTVDNDSQVEPTATNNDVG